jgi:hypothetical protein
VAPIAGVLSGNYEPVELLVAPKRYQMLTVGLRRKIKQTETYVEGVYTNNNINTFSNQNKSNDDGFGISAGLTNVQDVAIRKKQFILSNKLKTEIVNSDFRFLERYRPVEFERTWNKQLGLPQNTTTIKLPEIIANYDIELKQSDIFKLTYKTGLYYRSKDVNGLFNNLSSNISYKKTDLKAGFERMTNTIPLDSGNQSNAFYNYDFDLSHSFKPGKLGGAYHQERSTFQKQTDSIVTGSFAFNSGRLYFESTENERFSYGFSGERRIDRLPYMGDLTLSTQADELRWHGGYSHKKGGKLSLNGSYRHLNYLDTLVLKGQSEKNTLGRIEMDLPLLKKCLKLNTFYQIGSGQEQKREFTYLKVADGNGVYIWNDYDSNKLQTLNEFEIASDYDRKRANYIRTFIPVQGFLKSRNLQFNQTFNLVAPQAWIQKNGFRKMLSRLSVLIVYRTDRRTTSDEPSLYLNPFILTVNDLLLVNSNNALRYTLFVNRNNPLWSADLNYLNTQSKSLLVNGYETRQSHETTLNARVNVNRNYGVLVQVNVGDRSYFSELLKTRNYVYNFLATEPRLQFTSTNNNIGATLLGRYYRAEADTIFSQNLEAGLELRVSKVSKGSFTGNFRLVNIDFNGDAVSPLGYELMKGLLPGKNYTWNIVYQQRLSSNIQIDISYEGRKSQQSPVIHIGRVMARYLF